MYENIIARYKNIYSTIINVDANAVYSARFRVACGQFDGK